MIVTDRLKQIIFKRLYEELGNCEIIPYKSSIWFINRENKYWYFELEEGGTLWWRYHFFIPFFDMFSMSPDDFKSVLSSWVEEVLNCKVVTTKALTVQFLGQVEEVLNCKVVTTSRSLQYSYIWVEEVLNCKVVTTKLMNRPKQSLVEEVLNCRVVTSRPCTVCILQEVEEVLNCKVVTSGGVETSLHWSVEEILNQ